MRATKDQRLSLTPDELEDLRQLADEMDLKINRTVARAIRAQRLLWENTKRQAEESPEHADLLRRIARDFGTAELLNTQKTVGELEDGRPAIGTEDPPNDESAIFYIDGEDRLVVQLRRGDVVDHFLAVDGRLILPDRDREATAALI
jgi:hypothetical protein